MEDERWEEEKLAVDLASEFYGVLAKYLPPTTTLGELQVLTEVAKGMYRHAPLTVTQIAEATAMNRWSVSRILMRYIEAGMIIEEKDPQDSRRNLLVWTENAFSDNRKWSKDWMEVRNEGVERVRD